MSAPRLLWPSGWRDWLPGLLLSLPLALLLWQLRGASEGLRTSAAIAAVVLALPWVVPAMVLIATASAPLYMWLHTQGPVPDPLQWLGGTLLAGAVVGAHINAAIGWRWLHQGEARHEAGLGEFLRRAPRDGTRNNNRRA